MEIEGAQQSHWPADSNLTLPARLVATPWHTKLAVSAVLAGRETFRSSCPDKEQRAAMLTVAVQEHIADARPVFGERTA
jgi:hypothetical protein